MRIHRWLEDFESFGGRLVIENVAPGRADKIAMESDLTVLAAGKADLGRLIPRDDRRSYYSRPQRNLAMVIVRSKSGKHIRDWFSGAAPNLCPSPSPVVLYSRLFSMDSEPFCLSLSIYVCHNPRRGVGPDVGLINGSAD
jgi:hypothetical protein